MKLLLALLQAVPAVIEFWKELAAAKRRAEYTEAHNEIDDDFAGYLERKYGGVRLVGQHDSEGDVPGPETGGRADP